MIQISFKISEEEKMEILELEVQKREEVGKSYAKKIRREGLIPAVVYGKHEEPIAIQLAAKQLEKVLKSKSGENSLLSLLFQENSSEKVTAMLHGIQREILRPNIMHVDFKRISLEEKTIVMVPLHTVGTPDERGGVVEHLLRELEVECLPMNIPKAIEINVSKMKLGDSITKGDIKAPEGVSILGDAGDAVIIYNEVKEEKVDEAEALFAAEKAEPQRVGGKKAQEEE